MNASFIVVLSLIMIMLFVLLGPALLLWAVGTLAQGEGLDFTFWNCLAAFVVLILVNAGRAKS